MLKTYSVACVQSGLSADRPWPWFGDGMTQMELRKSRRVAFERGYDAHMMAIDGTWRRACKIQDISDTGAKLSVESSIEGLPLKEFFLLLSSEFALQEFQLVMKISAGANAIIRESVWQQSLG